MILKIDLPDSYEEAIVDTQIVNQEIITQQLIMQVNLINTGIEVDRAKTAKDVTITNSQADGNATVISNTAKADITANTVSYQQLAYNNAKSLLSFATNKDLLDYVFYLNVQSLDKTQGANLLVGVDSARVNVMSSGKGYGV